jgi:Ni/Co efflux regulator RcnB
MASHHTVHHTVHRVSTTHHRTTAALHHRTSTRLRSTAAARHARVNIAKFRRTMVATRHFHAGPYRAPPGFRYRRWAIGDRLPGLYFAPSFWISDFGIYGLLAPPYGYVWVRYGPDAVLIDEYTGEVISVDFGLFF